MAAGTSQRSGFGGITHCSCRFTAFLLVTRSGSSCRSTTTTGSMRSHEQLQLAACVRVAPRPHAQVYFRGQRLDPQLTVAEAGLAPLDRVDVVPEEG